MQKNLCTYIKFKANRHGQRLPSIQGLTLVRALSRNFKKVKVEKENRKEKIFKAAASCFTEYGYFKTSMEIVSKQANMTLRGLYYHFKSKDDLFIQLFQYMNSKYYAQIKEEAEVTTGPEEKLQMYVKIASKVLTDNADFLKICQEFLSIGTRNSEIRKVMTSFYASQVDRVKTIIQEGINTGRFVNTDAEKAARAIVLITMGVFNFHFSLDSDFDPAQQHAFDINLIIKGFKKFFSGKGILRDKGSGLIIVK